MESRLPDCLIENAADRAWRPPLDEFDLAVRLEAEGVTDEVANAVYGYGHTLAMARDWYPAARKRQAAAMPDAPAEAGWRAWLRGTAFALPMLLCALALLGLGVSLWGGDLPGDEASAVALATVASLVVTGGFVQATARRGLFYIGARDYRTAAALCLKWSQAAGAALAATALAALAANLMFAWLPGSLALTAAAFYLLLGWFWLACGGLYLVNRAAWIAGATVAGIAVVALLHRAAALPLIASQMAGVAAAAAIATAAAASWFRERVRGGVLLPPFVSLAREVYLAAPFFLYGACYYLFLFADRLIAWTAQTNAAALPLQFRGDYETALDLAMAAFVLQSGWVHASLAAFHHEATAAQRAMPSSRGAQFNAAMREFYWWRMARIAAFGFATSGLVYCAVERLHLLPFAALTPVLLLALAAFPGVVAGLWNASLLFALGRPKPALLAVASGAAASLTLGYLLTRTGGYEAAAVGFLAGAWLFAALSTLPVQRAFSSLDHHYYASAL